MDSNIDKQPNKDSILPNSTGGDDKQITSENSAQKGEQLDPKKLITKIDNRVKTKVFKTFSLVK